MPPCRGRLPSGRPARRHARVRRRPGRIHGQYRAGARGDAGRRRRRGAGAGPYLARRSARAPSGCARAGTPPSGERAIRTRPWPRGVSRRSAAPISTATEAFLRGRVPIATRARLGGQVLPHRRRPPMSIRGSSPTCEWDVAAGHAVVVPRQAGRAAPDGSGSRLWADGEDFRVRASSRGAIPGRAGRT